MDKLYVPGNKDWKNYQQNRKIFYTFLIIDIIIIVVTAIVGILVFNKINVIKNYDNSPETEYGIYQSAINEITGDDSIQIDSEDDINNQNEKVDKDMYNKTYIDVDNGKYTDNLIKNLPGPVVDRIDKELEEIDNMEIKDLKDALTATLYTDTLYYYTKIKAHDRDDQIIDLGCPEEDDLNLTYEDCYKEIKDNDYLDADEGYNLSVALNHADTPFDTNFRTGRTYRDSTMEVCGWLFSTGFNSPFYTTYHTKYSKILSSYIENKIWKLGQFKNISKQVVVEGKNEDYDGKKASLYMIFQMKGKNYKAIYYSSANSYKLLDIIQL